MKSGFAKRYVLPCIVVLTLFVMIPMALLFALYGFGQTGNVYETNSIEDYGKFIGNYDNELPTRFITSFFPAAVEHEFSNLVYHYKAQKGDTYAYEAYLEFVIEDSVAFLNYLTELGVSEASITFQYDTSFREYIVSDSYEIDLSNTGSDRNTPIRRAEIGKILYSKLEQRIIFVAIGVYDGGIARVGDFDFFFTRFQIDPLTFKVI